VITATKESGVIRDQAMEKQIEKQPLMAIVMEIHGTDDFRKVVEVVEQEMGEKYDPDLSSYSISKYTGRDSSHWIVLGKKTTERLIIKL
jgi:hypothetical protein